MRAVPVSGRSGGFDCSGAEHAVAADTAAPAITIFIVLGIPFILIILTRGLSGASCQGILTRGLSLPGAYEGTHSERLQIPTGGQCQPVYIRSRAGRSKFP